jgi:hypothetical protein
MDWLLMPPVEVHLWTAYGNNLRISHIASAVVGVARLNQDALQATCARPAALFGTDGTPLMPLRHTEYHSRRGILFVLCRIESRVVGDKLVSLS